jgi:hypothetical protein
MIKFVCIAIIAIALSVGVAALGAHFPEHAVADCIGCG